MAAWGAVGLIWMKLILPVLVRLVNKIPWNWRYTVTSIATVLMAVDVVMTLQALDCWYDRLSGESINTPIQDFYSKYYDNNYMANRFQSMTIVPDDAVRHGKV
jgi:nitrate/nitrite transporter NarK